MSLVAEHIQSMHGYVYGEQPRDAGVLKLNTNENPYPPSPAVRDGLLGLDMDALRLYPDATAMALRETIAERYGLSSQQVLITNGGDEAIRLLATACLVPNSVMVSTGPGYALYPVIAAIQQARWLPMDWIATSVWIPTLRGDACNSAHGSFAFLTRTRQVVYCLVLRKLMHLPHGTVAFFSLTKPTSTWLIVSATMISCHGCLSTVTSYYFARFQRGIRARALGLVTCLATRS